MFKLLLESFLIKTEFKHIWFTDQLTSMVGPLRDMEYTLCYYVHYNSKFLLIKIHSKKKNKYAIQAG